MANEMSVERWKIVLAFAAVYLIWGSTYLAIHFAIESVPPFLMAGTRFLVAGGLLYGWLWLRGQARPSPAEWRGSILVGALLLLGGNGGVTWAEQSVPSGVVSLLVALVPLWMVLLEWLWEGHRPTPRVVSGVALGFAGVALLIGPALLERDGPFEPLAALIVVGAALSWAAGSLLSRRVALPRSPLLATAMQMVGGGTLMMAVGLLSGEAGRFSVEALSLRSLLALAYLIVFGSWLGYSAYTWLLRVVSPSRVATYAYVNPVVAVLLGVLFAGETITPLMAAAALAILIAVGIIVSRRRIAAAPAPLAPKPSTP